MSNVIPSGITQEGICNMALGHLKIVRQIGNLVTDQSAEAVACRTFYDVLKLKMLEDFKWPFGTTQGSLALVENNPFPIDTEGDSEWAFAYQYPSNCVNFIRIISGIRNESRMDRVPFRIFNNSADGTKMILTDMDSAIGEWTINAATEDMFTAALSLALSYLIASVIAPMVTGGDPFKLGDRAMQLYEKTLIQAQGNALNEEQMEIEPESEFVLARGYRGWDWTSWFRR